MTQIQPFDFESLGPVLRRGDRFAATTTGVLRGRRIFRTCEFVASRDQVIESGSIPAGPGVAAQDRVFVQHPHGSVPELVVQGSIRILGGAL